MDRATGQRLSVSHLTVVFTIIALQVIVESVLNVLTEVINGGIVVVQGIAHALRRAGLARQGTVDEGEEIFGVALVFVAELLFGIGRGGGQAGGGGEAEEDRRSAHGQAGIVADELFLEDVEGGGDEGLDAADDTLALAGTGAVELARERDGFSPAEDGGAIHMKVRGDVLVAEPLQQKFDGRALALG